MPDQDLRVLERAAAAGDAEAGERLLRERLRRGDLDALVRLLALDPVRGGAALRHRLSQAEERALREGLAAGARAEVGRRAHDPVAEERFRERLESGAYDRAAELIREAIDEVVARCRRDLSAGARFELTTALMTGNMSHVRRRPAMYVGDLRGEGALRLWREVLDDAVARGRGADAVRIEVRVDGEGAVTVSDDAPQPAWEPVTDPLTGRRAPRHLVEPGCHPRPALRGRVGFEGIGLAIVNALSDRFELRWPAEASGGGVRQLFRCGEPETEPLPRDDGAGGTAITFRPDPSIFPNSVVDLAALRRRLEELAYLRPGWTFTFSAPETGEATFHQPRGLAALVASRCADPVTPVFALAASAPVSEVDPRELEVALALTYDRELAGDVVSYANLTPTEGGGAHVDGLGRAVRRVLEEALRARGRSVSGFGARRGLVAAISILVEHTALESFPRPHLVDARVGEAVARCVATHLPPWLAAHPEAAEAILGRVAGA